MRVLYLTYYYLPHAGGGTWTTYFITLHLVRQGHLVNLVYPNISHKMTLTEDESLPLDRKNGSRKFCTPKLLKLPRVFGPLLSFPFLLFRALQLAKQSDVIIVQYHPYHCVALVGVLVGKMFGLPTIARADDIYRKIVVYHNSHSEENNTSITPRLLPSVKGTIIKILNMVNEFVLSFYDSVLVVCDDQRSEILKRMHHTNVQISHNGYEPVATPLSISEGKDDKPDKIVLMLGRFSGEEYGTKILLQSMSRVIKVLPYVKLLLVGDKLTDKQKELIRSLGLESNVVIHGPTSHDEALRFIVQADVCVGPLFATRTIPLKVLEYMSFAKPVILGYSSTDSNLARHGYSCLVVRPNPEDMSEAIIELLTDNELYSKLSQGARDVSSNFSWNNITRALADHAYSQIKEKCATNVLSMRRQVTSSIE